MKSNQNQIQSYLLIRFLFQMIYFSFFCYYCFVMSPQITDLIYNQILQHMIDHMNTQNLTIGIGEIKK